jgi:tetratricopeptide (TPR) repeat protein
MFFFKKKKDIDPDTLIQENWSAPFNKPKKARFTAESTEDYSVSFKNKHFSLTLNKKDIFAWAIDNVYRYNDFVINAETEFNGNNGYSSLGFILRYINDDNFYFFLISDNNHFRFDVVFNGNPIPLISWTECKNISESVNLIKIVARLDHFSFYLDDVWIGEVHDSTIREGRIGFAGQNYNKKDTAEFHLLNLTVESRPLEVEKAFIRWNQIIPINPDNRFTLAKSYFKQGRFSAAAVQFKKLSKSRKLTGEENFLFAETLIILKLYKEALYHINITLELLPDKKEALHAKANILYLLNRMQEAKEHMEAVLSKFEDNAPFLNQLGNVEHALGNMDSALESYNNAIEIQAEMPLFKINKAKILEIKGKNEEALQLYIESARLLFRQEAYTDLTTILLRIKRIDPDNKEARAINARMFFDEGKRKEAKQILQKLVKEKYEDSSVYFLFGLILSEEDNRKKALTHFKKACKLEPEFPTYWLKYAENKFLLGENPEKELKEAYKNGAMNPWINNLYGLVLCSKDKHAEAESYFAAAYKSAPEEIDICINYSDCLKHNNKVITAFSIIEKRLKADEKNAKLLNQLGNLYTVENNYESAFKYYSKALSIEPENTDYIRNCSTICIELDMILKAEELLFKLEELNPCAETYSMIANLSKIKGEYRRAEVSLLKGIETEPEELSLFVNLAALYFETGSIERAKELAQNVLSKDKENRKAEILLAKIKEKTEERIICASCSTEWWVPKNISVQPSFKIHGEPPGECPAGKCPECNNVYCISCASEHLKDSRFICKDCGVILKLTDNALRYLVIKYTEIET